MKQDTGRLVRELFDLRAVHGGGSGARKRALLAGIAPRDIRRAGVLSALHEAVLFLLAWPDSPAVLAAAQRAARSIARRAAALSERERDALDESGIDGTAIHCAYSLPVVRWLTGLQTSGSLRLYAESEGLLDRLSEALPALLPRAEAEALLDGYLDAGAWMERLGTPPLAQLLAIFERLPWPLEARELAWATLDLPVRWELGGDGSRTLTWTEPPAAVFQTAPLAAPPGRGPVDLEAASATPLAFERLGREAAGGWIHRARGATIARLREMLTFVHASDHDVWEADLGHGLRLAWIGVEPARRHPLRTFHGYLLERNGVPVAYGDAIVFAEWGELNFHVFDTFRQAGSSFLYAAVVRALRAFFGTRFLYLNPYQFGAHNDDAIRSGAYWFYEKLGFRHADSALDAVRLAERRRMTRRPAHRSSPATLRRLAARPMSRVFGGDDGNGDGNALAATWTNFHPMNVALAASRSCSSSRSRGDGAVERLRALIGPLGAEGEAALVHLAPLLDLLPDLETWTAAERSALAAVVRAKGSVHEIDFHRALASHARLRDALRTLGRAPGE